MRMDKSKLQELTFMSILVLMFVIAVSLGMVATAMVSFAQQGEEAPVEEPQVDAEQIIDEIIQLIEELNNTNETPEDEIVDEEEDIEFLLVTDYLKAHEHEDFGEQASRITHVKLYEGGTEAVLRYEDSNADADFESWYLSGVLFVVFPEVEKADVSCFDEDGDFVLNSYKYPTREQYTPNPKYFSDEQMKLFEKIECSIDADCADNTNCTIDKCYNQKCSNVWLVSSECGTAD